MIHINTDQYYQYILFDKSLVLRDGACTPFDVVVLFP